ncbi:non-ribosomal peptide synthetase [Iodobacter sp. LRB]|uniref:non-ribosomal peptide synthetase n=1 Tax=unclassified Iodobacter TaxID=235634 RepID=UPI000C0CC458|nr:non-ribosomal peptide synthetase [Iodobacter sp. BJB302]PHV03199.1 non-ribosomal peptide synthetase [Iodobacter sp. BJB302]
MLSTVTQNSSAESGLELPIVGSQLGIWLADQISPLKNGYTVAHYTELQGALDVACLQRAVRQGLSEADTLHARFREGDSGPVQYLPLAVDADCLPDAEFLDLSDQNDAGAAVLALMRADLDQAGAADSGQALYRHIIFKAGNERWFWYQRYHHVCVDGYSFSALTRRIAAIYTDLQQGHAVSATPFVSFARVVDEYLAYQQSALYQRDRQFWQDYSADLAQPVSLTAHHGGQSFANVNALKQSFQLQRSTGLPADVSEPELLMAGIFAYLSRMTGSARPVLGVPFMRRMGSAALNAIGPVVNVLPLQLRVDTGLSLCELAKRLALELQRVRRHQRYDAEQVQRDMGAGRRPLYGPGINLKIYEQSLQLGSLQATTHILAAGPVDDLEFGIALEEQQLVLSLTANPDRYQPEELVLHCERLSAFLNALMASPHAPIDTLALLAPAETARLEKWSAGPAIALPEINTVIDLFQQQALQSAGYKALVFGAETLDFSGLSAKVARLARLLMQQGIGRGDIVAIALPRSVDSVVSVLAVLSAGAAYLPLDLDYPKDRLAMLCDDAQPALLLALSNCDLLLQAQALYLDSPDCMAQLSALSALPLSDSDRAAPLNKADPAYIIYTSGSTGKPKGVMVSHGSLLNLLISHQHGFIADMMQRLGGRRVRAAHSTSFSFDASWEPLFFLLLGHELHLCDEELRRDAQALHEFIQAQQIDMLDVPPPVLQQLLACGLAVANHVPDLILIGGEAVSPALWNELRQYPRLHVYNFYGPTEYTIDALGACVSQAKQPVIGRPVANTQAYVLNHALQKVAQGVVGDLYLAGEGMALGYLRRPGQTASRFVANPFAEGRMYRTGDLVRWRSDGLLEFIGRADFQIKVRGFRIEPGEVEHALLKLPGVKGAVVIAEPLGASHRLIAYCTAEHDAPGLNLDLLARLAGQLPDYMVPSALMILPAWPLNVNGKIDKEALPKPAQQSQSRPAASDAEHLLCNGVAKVLGLEILGPDDDFFHLGGDSISAMALGSELRRAGFLLRPRDVFSQRTPARMATILERLDSAPTAGSEATGRLGRLPIVSWFAEHYGLDRCFAQGVLLRIPKEIQPAHLHTALHALQRSHPVLRARADEQGLLLTADWDTAQPEQQQLLPQDDFSAVMDARFAAACASLKPSAGKMMQAVHFAGEAESFLMLVLHHLLIDGVSWRILLADLQEASEAALNNTAALLLRESCTVQDWAQRLAGQIPARRAELALWQAALAGPSGGRVLDPVRDTYGSASQSRTLLDAGLSAALLSDLPAAYQAQIEELMLLAVSLAYSEVFASPRVSVSLESHGRQLDDGHADLSRTIGWLTSEYPLAIELKNLDLAGVAAGSHAAAEAVKAIKRSTRAIADKGLGYGILRYLDDENGPALAKLEAANRPQFLFNYLGRFTGAAEFWAPQSTAGYFADAFAVHTDPTMPLLYGLEVNLFTEESSSGPQLALNWTWATALFSKAEIAALHQRFTAYVAGLMHFAKARPLLALDTLVGVETPVSDSALHALSQRYGPLAAVLPALPLQEGLLFHAQLGDAGSKYNSITRIELLGPLDTERLRDALEAVLDRHPQLAAMFDDESGSLQLLPLVSGHGRRWPWAQQDISHLSKAEQQAELARSEQQELNRDFVIGGADILLNALLIRQGHHQHTLCLTAHHLVVDGWSTPILLGDLLRAYGDGTLAATRVDYATVVKQLAARPLAATRAIWTDVLAGVKPTVLFGDNPEPGKVNTLELVVPDALEQALTAKARQQGLTLNSMMQGMWAALLSIMSGRNDVVFGSPVSGRFSPGVEEHIGLFSNTLPVRVRLNPHQPLLAQLAAVQAQQIQLLEHDGLGLGEIQRLAGAPTLFDTLLVVENYPEQDELLARDYHGLRVGALRNRGYTHYPLTVLVLPGQQLRLVIEYRDVVQDVARWAERILMLLSHLADDADLPWAAFKPQIQAEQALIQSLNATDTPLPAHTLCDLLQAQAERTPDVVALQDVERSLSYRQMRLEVAQLAGHLQAAGVGAGDIVAVALPRSAHLSLALMAVLEAGAAYLPLDVGYPAERLSYMVADAKPRLIISDSTLAARFAGMGPLLLADRLPGQAPQQAAVMLTPDHAAYLLYTSGSTGHPKGVLVSHRAIVNRLVWMQHEYALQADDVVLQKTPCSFDVSVWEFFWPLMYGAKLFMAPPEAHKDPEELLALIAEQQITTLHFVPSMLAAFIAQPNALSPDCASLRRVFCSGEALPRELADRYAALIAAPLHNLYGPTEAAVDVTYKPAQDKDVGTARASSVPIGRPVWNTQLRVLDAYLREVPLGVAGDLYLTGVQLADGYLGRASLTAGRFVADPFAAGGRMYRTGDVVRYLPTGDVEYLGRSDDQLKIRGQRIELGEIEAALLQQPGIARAVVHARLLGVQVAATGADARQLLAYAIAEDCQSPPDPQAVLAALAQVLPAYMVPVALVYLSEFPLSANGKLDRKALPEPVLMANSARRAPRAGLESQIANVFAQILGQSLISAEDDFFMLGGHSLMAMRLAAALRSELKRPVSVGQIMVASSVQKLAALLSDEQQANDPNNAGFGEVLYLRAGLGKPLFFIHPASGFAWQYSGFARQLSGQWPLIGLQSPRPDGVIATCANMDEVCDRHLANLLRIQPQGPYHLLGYSFGGAVAHGLAARLQAMGEQVAFLGLFDMYPPEEQDWTAPSEEEANTELDREREQFMLAAEEGADEFMLREKTEMFEQIVANYADAVRLLSSAHSSRFDGKAQLFVASRTLPADWDIQARWAAYVEELEAHYLDCAHEDIVSPESLTVLGPLLDQILTKTLS